MAAVKQNWALVTGASSGLGVALATALAARQSNLILVARREGPMRELAARLRDTFGVEAVVEAIDLSEANAAAALADRLDKRGVQVDILVNNAAFGLAGAFVEHDPERLRSMLSLDIVALTELTQLFGKRMAARGHGHILLVASLAAYQPTPLLAAYGAGKAYVLAFGMALHVELAPKVGVTVLTPGLMNTGFNEVSGFKPKAGALQRTVLAPASVAEIGLDALFAGKSSVVAGRLNGIMAFSTRLMSRHQQAKMVLRMSKG
ncbi:SDR family NAD(P)-dependent oxidoreductase [Lichenicoccus sp.]|uniref:SDR family NAD(P)-dependent oxidoreductase n=1 Tax=Lichenicoccus sp. TaxID=2781899 RepID=UPI003D14A876